MEKFAHINKIWIFFFCTLEQYQIGERERAYFLRHGLLSLDIQLYPNKQPLISLQNKEIKLLKSLESSPRTENKCRIFNWESLINLDSQSVSAFVEMLAQLFTSSPSSGMMVPVQTGIAKDSRHPSIYLPVKGLCYLHQWGSTSEPLSGVCLPVIENNFCTSGFHISCFSSISILIYIQFLSPFHFIFVWSLTKSLGFT